MIALNCRLTKMLPAHPAICLIDCRHQLPLLCSKTRNNRAMLKAGWPQERRRALLSRSVVPGAPGGMVVAASPKQIHFLSRTWGGAYMMMNLLLCWFLLWGRGQCVWRCYHSYQRNQDTVQKTESPDREKVSFQVKNTSRNVTEGNVEMTTGRNAKAKVTTTPRIQTLLCPLTAHTLKWQSS